MPLFVILKSTKKTLSLPVCFLFLCTVPLEQVLFHAFRTSVRPLPRSNTISIAFQPSICFTQYDTVKCFFLLSLNHTHTHTHMHVKTYLSRFCVCVPLHFSFSIPIFYMSKYTYLHHSLAAAQRAMGKTKEIHAHYFFPYYWLSVAVWKDQERKEAKAEL